jgi:hypothetical protein
MPQFVTPIFAPLRDMPAASVLDASLDASEPMSDAYRRRLAALRLRAPDTLRARVRRELRAAAESFIDTE